MKAEMSPNPAVKAAIDDCLSGLSALPSQRHLIMQKARGEIQVKKKVSLGLALVMALILMAATAVAVVSIRELARNMAQTEQEQGYFAQWPLEKKKEAIKGLADLHYIQDSAELRQLLKENPPQEEAHQLADRVITAFTGEDAATVSFLNIMQKVWGPSSAWNHEQKAWYSGLMAEVGQEMEGKTVFMEPQGPIDENEAISIARKALARGYGVPESTLDSYLVQVDFAIPEANEPEDRQPWWHITFEAPEGMSKEERLFILFPLLIHPDTGELMHTVEEMRSW